MTSEPTIELHGRWNQAHGRPALNPANETGAVPTATIADLGDAVAAAEHGFS